MTKILILFSTTDGHTKEICLRLKQAIGTSHETTLLAISESDNFDLDGFDKIVIGASIHYGKHSPLVHRFIRCHESVLNSKPNAFFSVCLVARKPEKNTPETNPYLKKFLKNMSWRPQKMAVFAGKLNYPIYGMIDRQMIRLIMWMTNGPTDTSAVTEFTDWQKVEEFGRVIADM